MRISTVKNILKKLSTGIIRTLKNKKMVKRKAETNQTKGEVCSENADEESKSAKKLRTNTEASDENREEEISRLSPLKWWLSLAEDAIGKDVAEIAVKNSKFVGAHISIAKGLHFAPKRAAETGCRSFALFLNNSRSWKKTEIKDEIATKFRQKCVDFGFSVQHIVPHGSYLINLGSPNPDTAEKSFDRLLYEVQCCEKLGICFYNFHPGSTCGRMSVEDCIKQIVASLNSVLNQTKSVTLLVETMAGQGNTIGSFDDLKQIIELIEDKSRIGVCLDTCHAFASGYDITQKEGYEKMMAELESKIGLQYLKAIHLNDSKDGCGSRTDRHENIGKGKIGLNGFECIMNDSRLDKLPLILETPTGLSDSEEIKILYKMQKS